MKSFKRKLLLFAIDIAFYISLNVLYSYGLDYLYKYTYDAGGSGDGKMGYVISGIIPYCQIILGFLCEFGLLFKQSVTPKTRKIIFIISNVSFPLFWVWANSHFCYNWYAISFSSIFIVFFLIYTRVLSKIN
jgi:hypothetical protein